MNTIIGLGEVLWDEFDNYKRPGGAPANVAYHANILGSNGIIASSVGDDHSGSELIKFFQRKKIPVDHIQRNKEKSTGKVSVTMHGSEASYVIHEDTAWDHLKFSEEWKTLAKKADAVCFGSLAQRNEISRNTILTFLDHCSSDCIRVFDVNLRPPFFSGEVIIESLKRTDVIKLNEHEFRQLPEITGSTKSTKELLLDDYGISVICLTKGAKGCEIITPDSHFIEGPFEIDTSLGDSVGVGDSFTATLIHNKLKGRKWQEALHLANKYAANMAALKGAMPDVPTKIISEVQ